MLRRFTFCFLLMLALLPALDSHAGTVQLPATGQTTCYDTAGAVITCAGTGQDGAIQAGVAWPTPRFTDNGNGTVTDNLTGLIWLKNADCTDTVGGIDKSNGYLDWASALTWSNNLASEKCGLTDGSAPGAWRLPSRRDLYSLVDLQNWGPALPAGHPFSNVQPNGYWSSSSCADGTDNAWGVDVYNGVVACGPKSGFYRVWPFRGGQ